jgi:DNA invertase Pin-like site-specific DNA recombinase
LRRQLQWGEQLATRKGWTLDESLHLQDLGVSAFRGENSATEALAGFLEAIRTHKVKAGDVLLVESLDRLTREAAQEALGLFLAILKTGVEIYTCEPERHYTRASTAWEIMEALVFMERAHNESSTKSMRGLAYWQERRKHMTGQPIHQYCPAWLKLSENKSKFVVIPQAAKAIKLIFKWAGEGLGLNPITAKLNAKGIEPIARKDIWCRSYVAKLLKDKALLGYFQPHAYKGGQRVPVGDAILDYFPQIITEREWYAVRHAVKERGKELGPRGVGVASLFTSLIHDARDGEKMHLIYSSSSRKNNTRMLLSWGARNGKPGSVRLPFAYDGVERAFGATLKELTASDLLGGEIDTREEDIAALSGRLEELNEKIHKVQERVEQEPEIEALLRLLERLDRERKSTSERLEQLRASTASQQPSSLDEAQSLIKLLGTVQGEQRRELRLKIRARIKQLVSEIWVLIWDVAPTIRAAEVQVFFHTGKRRTLVLAWSRRGRNRGKIGGAGFDAKSGADLRQYRSDPKVRKSVDANCRAVNSLITSSDWPIDQLKMKWDEAT